MITKEIHFNQTANQWELNCKKITFETARKYWLQEGSRKANSTQHGYNVMCQISIG